MPPRRCAVEEGDRCFERRYGGRVGDERVAQQILLYWGDWPSSEFFFSPCEPHVASGTELLVSSTVRQRHSHLKVSTAFSRHSGLHAQKSSVLRIYYVLSSIEYRASELDCISSLAGVI